MRLAGAHGLDSTSPGSEPFNVRELVPIAGECRTRGKDEHRAYCEGHRQALPISLLEPHVELSPFRQRRADQR